MSNDILTIWSHYKDDFDWIVTKKTESLAIEPENYERQESLANHKSMRYHMLKLISHIEKDRYFNDIQSCMTHFAVRFGNNNTDFCPVWLQFIIPNKYHISIPKHHHETIVTIDGAIQTIKEFIRKAEFNHQENL